MKIKICCEQIGYYIEHYYITLNGENKAEIDTSMYEENEVEIEYCPFCGGKIEIIEGEMP